MGPSNATFTYQKTVDETSAMYLPGDLTPARLGLMFRNTFPAPQPLFVVLGPQ